MAAIGFALLNLTFIFNYLVFQFIDIFMPGDPESVPRWLPMVRHILFLIIIALISWIIFRLKLPALIKASFLTVPTAVVLVTIGILLYPSPILPYLLSGVLTLGVLLYFYLTKKPWLYYYSVVLVALALMVFTLMGGEI